MAEDRTHLMGKLNDDIDELRTLFYQLLEFESDNYSEKKSLAKREVLYALNELRIKTENM